MLIYKKKLKKIARKLRNNSTDSEVLLWSKLRQKQILDVQFYRQKPIGNYIADFYAPATKLIIEVDGGQHFEEDHMQKDKKRDLYMQKLGLITLRFNNLQIMQDIQTVMEVIYNVIELHLEKSRLKKA